MRDYSRLQKTAFSHAGVGQLRALVVGAGALGNEVIKNLCLMGIGGLQIIDHDHIENSNLTRSVLFCIPGIQADIDARTPKAEVAARRARELNPDVKVRSSVLLIADLGAGDVRRADIVFSCLDNEMARIELSWLCGRIDVPLVDGGLGLLNHSAGMVSLFPGSHGPCFACRVGSDRRRALLTDLQGREDPCAVKERAQQRLPSIPTTPTMASVVGALQVERGIRYALDRRELRPEQEDGLSYLIELHPRVRIDATYFSRSPHCPLHDPDGAIGVVDERVDRTSETWTAAQLLAESGGGTGSFLSFDWPMTASATCRTCAHRWEPLVRRARFRGSLCPRCQSNDLVENEVLTGVTPESPWATRSLVALGLPRSHIHEIVGPGHARRHVEVTGDLAAPTQAE